jgi:hypothetical protein
MWDAFRAQLHMWDAFRAQLQPSHQVCMRFWAHAAAHAHACVAGSVQLRMRVLVQLRTRMRENPVMCAGGLQESGGRGGPSDVWQLRSALAQLAGPPRGPARTRLHRGRGVCQSARTSRDVPHQHLSLHVRPPPLHLLHPSLRLPLLPRISMQRVHPSPFSLCLHHASLAALCWCTHAVHYWCMHASLAALCWCMHAVHCWCTHAAQCSDPGPPSKACAVR